MTYETCKRCSKMLNKNGNKYCNECLETTEKEYDLIWETSENKKEYIKLYGKILRMKNLLKSFAGKEILTEREFKIIKVYT